MTDETPDRPPTLAEKIDALFRSAPGREEYTYAEVAEGIRRLGGPTISTTQLWELRHGVKTNPRKDHLQALARFFGAPITYFFDDEETRQLYAQLKLLAAMRDSQIERIALRASGLSPATLATIAQVIERMRQIEGLPNGNGEERKPSDDDQDKP